MRVLWLMNEPLPDLADALNLSDKTHGGWTIALAQGLIQDGRVELGIASRISVNNFVNTTINGIQYFTVPTSIKGFGLIRPTKKMLNRYQEIVNLFSPDVIHIHGTEWYGGIVSKNDRLGVPAVVSLQGLLAVYKRFLFGNLGFFDILKSRTLRDWILFRGLWEIKTQWDKREIVEREIIEGHTFFIGRTHWDKSNLYKMNPGAQYFHCDEIVQQDFFDQKWDISKSNRHTIFAPSASYPLKGFHILVKAAAILKKEFPDIQIRVPLARFTTKSNLQRLYVMLRKDGYANYLSNLINNLGMRENIFPFGILSRQQMIEEMLLANVFTLPSYMENSPNSMAEALTIGVPSVVSLVGGVPSFIVDGQNALGFPPGDEAALAEQIRRIFLDDNLAVRLSNEGRLTASQRYSSLENVEKMIHIYESIIKNYNLS